MDSDEGKLFIGGLAWDTTEDKLTDYFNQYGDVTQTVIMRDKTTGRPRGFGFVVFSDPSVLDRVLNDKHTIDGRVVEAKKAHNAPLLYHTRTRHKITNLSSISTQPKPPPESMASTANPFSISISSKPTLKASVFTPNNSAELSLRVQSSKSASLRSSFVSQSSVELTRRGNSALRSTSRIMASSAQVVDQPPSKTGPVAPTIVDVDLGNRSYPIYIGSGLLDQPELLQRHVHGKKVLVVTNNTVGPLYLDKVVDALTRDNPNVMRIGHIRQGPLSPREVTYLRNSLKEIQHEYLNGFLELAVDWAMDLVLRHCHNFLLLIEIFVGRSLSGRENMGNHQQWLLQSPITFLIWMSRQLWRISLKMSLNFGCPMSFLSHLKMVKFCSLIENFLSNFLLI